MEKFRTILVFSVFTVCLCKTILGAGNHLARCFPVHNNQPYTSYESKLTEPAVEHSTTNKKPSLPNGLSFDVKYSSDLSANVSGGLQQKAVYLGNLDLQLTADLDELTGWHNATFYFYGLANHGASPILLAGDIQGTSNIDAPNTWKLYELWLQQNLWNDRLSLLFGLFDLNSEFDVLESAGLFLNSSHGIGADFAQTGLAGPSIFPCTSLAARLRFQPWDNLYLQTVVAQDRILNSFGLFKGLDLRNMGLLFTGELGCQKNQDNGAASNKVAVGIHYYTTKFGHLLETDPDGLPLMQRSKPGVYLLAEHKAYSEKQHPTQGLTVFGRVGFADAEFNRLGSYTGVGLVYTGLLRGRSDDQCGFAVAAAHNGGPFKQLSYRLGSPITRSEVTLELTYRFVLSRSFVIQPDLQYVINPGMSPYLNNAFLINTRFEIII